VAVASQQLLQVCTTQHLLVLLLLLFLLCCYACFHCCCRLDYSDVICDGFYDIEGDFPEITDNPADFPTIAALRHVRCFEADPREVGRQSRDTREKKGG